MTGWSREAGLTHGGFYNHFASKDDLAAAVCNASFAASLGVLAQAVEDGDAPAGSPQRRVVDDYLSAEHCDAADGSCPSASLVIDAGRHDETMKRSFAAGVEGCLAGFASELAREHDGELAPWEVLRPGGAACSAGSSARWCSLALYATSSRACPTRSCGRAARTCSTEGRRAERSRSTPAA
ncbi:hypothetical protein ACIPPR_13260 [Streptomyces nigra]|uniref:hypothetical protein n=1 Tax=Streptomyces nigra TaxID=1827580 RepID=UPI00380695E8